MSRYELEEMVYQVCTIIGVFVLICMVLAFILFTH